MPWLGRDPIYASSQIINNMQSLLSRRADLTQGMGVIFKVALRAMLFPLKLIWWELFALIMKLSVKIF